MSWLFGIVEKCTINFTLVCPGGGGGHSTFKWSGCAAGGLKIGPCHKPLGAQKIHPVLIYLTKITKNTPCLNIPY